MRPPIEIRPWPTSEPPTARNDWTKAELDAYNIYINIVPKLNVPTSPIQLVPRHPSLSRPSVFGRLCKLESFGVPDGVSE